MIIYCGEDDEFEYEVPSDLIDDWLDKHFSSMRKKDIYTFMKENDMWFKGAYEDDKQSLIVNLIDLKNEELEDYFRDELEYEFNDMAEDAYSDWYAYERNDDDFSSRGLSWKMF